MIPEIVQKSSAVLYVAFNGVAERRIDGLKVGTANGILQRAANAWPRKEC